MTDIDWLVVTGLTVRVTAFCLWALLAIRYWATPWPVTGVGRRQVLLVVVVGLGCFVIGGLSPFLVPGWLARLTYTAFASYAAIVGLALLTYRSK